MAGPKIIVTSSGCRPRGNRTESDAYDSPERRTKMAIQKKKPVQSLKSSGASQTRGVQNRIVTGFKTIGLEGEEVIILKGMDTDNKPSKVTVVKECPKHLVLELTFTHKFLGKTYCYRKCANKGAMLCGDLVLKRLSDGIILFGEEVGIYTDEK